MRIRLIGAAACLVLGVVLGVVAARRLPGPPAPEPVAPGGGVAPNGISVSGFVEEILRRGVEHEMTSPVVKAPPPGDGTYDPVEQILFQYDFDAVRRAEARVSHLDEREVLRAFFAAVTADVPAEDDAGRWLVVSDAVSRVMRHPPLTQPMYPDKRYVTDPVVLLALGEGRCFHVACLVVDLALANGYEARKVHLATHFVAEVKFDGRWHLIDANADFPLEALRRTLGDLPGVRELSRDPRRLDALPLRGWQWAQRDVRCTSGTVLPHVLWAPAPLLTSSVYFGREILRRPLAESEPEPRKGVTNFYKTGDHRDWHGDRHYGWWNLTDEVEAVDGIPVEFHPSGLDPVAPAVVRAEGGRVTIPVRFLPARRMRVAGEDVRDVRPDPEPIGYEIRVSRGSRGWDYDYRNYACMPARGAGDVRVVREIAAYAGGMRGADVTLEGAAGSYFVEVIPRIASLEKRGVFLWPSRELHVQVLAGRGPDQGLR